MKKIREIKIEGNLILGSTVIITVIFDYEPGGSDTVKISIEDPSDTLKIDAVDMTKLTNNVYRYFYQSSINDDDGVWVATVKATSGTSVIYESCIFELVENPLKD